MTTATQTRRIIRKRELLTMLGLSDPTVYRMEKAGRFPKRLRLGGNSCGWLQQEVDQWIDERAANRSEGGRPVRAKEAR